MTKTPSVCCDPYRLKHNQVFYLNKSYYAVLRACHFYENRNIFQLFLTSVKKNCIIIFFCETR
ncbi:hypothetical protein [Helicobacter pylori]|uniref:hypothetical protein n=1 Tax=Helicobacter pylori TaxID=210 RepID=UPI0031B9F48C